MLNAKCLKLLWANRGILNNSELTGGCSSAPPGVVPERSGQVPEEPAAAGERRRRRGQGVGRLHAARPGLGPLQRLHEPRQHPHHPHRLEQPHHAHRHLRAQLGAGRRRHGRARVPEPITDHTDEPLLMEAPPPPHWI